MKYLVYLVVFLNFEPLRGVRYLFFKDDKSLPFYSVHYSLCFVYLVDSDTGDPLDNKIK